MDKKTKIKETANNLIAEGEVENLLNFIAKEAPEFIKGWLTGYDVEKKDVIISLDNEGGDCEPAIDCYEFCKEFGIEFDIGVDAQRDFDHGNISMTESGLVYVNV